LLSERANRRFLCSEATGTKQKVASRIETRALNSALLRFFPRNCTGPRSNTPQKERRIRGCSESPGTARGTRSETGGLRPLFLPLVPSRLSTPTSPLFLFIDLAPRLASSPSISPSASGMASLLASSLRLLPRDDVPSAEALAILSKDGKEYLGPMVLAFLIDIYLLGLLTSSAVTYWWVPLQLFRVRVVGSRSRELTFSPLASVFPPLRHQFGDRFKYLIVLLVLTNM
jgi:hypothetical protein